MRYLMQAKLERLSWPASRYASAISMMGRGLPIGGLEDSFASKISIRPTRSYSAEIVSSQ
jgi:hypothetical protein